MTLFGYRIPTVFSLLIWAGIWEIIGRLDVVFVFPPLSRVLVALVKVAQQNNFHEAALISLQAFGLGMAIAIVGGILLGILMGRVVPVLMLLFGLGQTTIIVTVVLFAIWIITLDTYAGVRHINPSLLEMGESFGASRWQLYSKLLIWAALPEILAGIRMGLIRAVKGVVIGQLLVSVIALGQMFSRYSRSFLMEEFWALTLILFAFALGLSALIGMLEQRVEYYAGARA
jgi:NitT/TauT family transport system permease protein